MGRWLRWYEGTCEDGKFRVVARKSRVTVRDVIALWAFMLEDAAHLDHRGVCNRDEDFMAGVLDFDDGVVERILGAMDSMGLISIGIGAITICNFEKRQFDSDVDRTANERQKRKRERDRSGTNADVTRDSRPSDTDTDTDTDTESSVAIATAAVAASEPPPDIDLKKCAFDEGIRLLTSAGESERSARSFIAGLCKDHNDESVLDEIRQCADNPPAEPKSWLRMRLPAKRPLSPNEELLTKLAKRLSPRMTPSDIADWREACLEPLDGFPAEAIDRAIKSAGQHSFKYLNEVAGYVLTEAKDWRSLLKDERKAPAAAVQAVIAQAATAMRVEAA